MLKYDLQAINAYFEQVLDKLQASLVIVNQYVLRSKLKGDSPLSLLITCIDLWEAALLQQWQTLQIEGVEAMCVRQSVWLSEQQKKEDGVFVKWNLFCRLLIDDSEKQDYQEGDLWQTYVMFRLCNRAEWDLNINWRVLPKNEVIKEQLEIAIWFYFISPCDLFLEVLSTVEIGAKYRPCISTYPVLPLKETVFSPIRQAIQTKDIEQIKIEVETFWKTTSGGIFSSHLCLYWQQETKVSFLRQTKKVTFNDLFTFSREEKKLRNNTENFIQGKEFHHMLLWGARGSGKSMSLQALVNAYADQGVRLLFLQPQQIQERFSILATISKRQEYFILCIDDAIWDMSTLGLWKNFLDQVESLSYPYMICVLSNRKDLLQHGDLDMKKMESNYLLDERLALQDRFGFKLYYPAFETKEISLFLEEYRQHFAIQETQEKLMAKLRKFAALQQYDQISKRTIRSFIKEYIKDYSI